MPPRSHLDGYRRVKRVLALIPRQFAWRRTQRSSVRSANPTAKRGKMIDICDCKLVGELAPFGEVGPRPARAVPFVHKFVVAQPRRRFAVRIIRLRKPRLGRHPPGHKSSDLFVFRVPRSACLFLSLLLLLFSGAVAFAPVCPPPLFSCAAATAKRQDVQSPTGLHYFRVMGS